LQESACSTSSAGHRASRGIGRAIAHTLCKANFAIIVASPEIENNEKVAAKSAPAAANA